jgi:NAD-dependent deacetylase
MASGGSCELGNGKSILIGHDQRVAGASQIQIASELLAAAERVTVLTGAGISTDSGIPDFRGPNGIWTRNPAAEKASDIRYYLADPEVRRASWQARVEMLAFSAQPNAGHRSIVEIERVGILHALITQNIDELHQRAGNDPDRVIEVHGTVWWSRCLGCGDRRPMPETLERVRAGEADPECLVCAGILKSDTISFGQSLVPEVIDRALRVSGECDLMLAVGTTLSVYPVASCVPAARAGGARVIIINGEPTAMDEYADVVVRDSISEVLPQLVPAR